MTDYLIEQLVKQNKTNATTWKQAGLLAATLASLFLTLKINQIFGVLVIVMIVVDVIMFRRMKLEFEYIYFNGDLDIDKIMNMQSRKRIFSTNMKEVEVIAPTGSAELQPYRELKLFDYSTNTEGNITYEMVTSYKGEQVRVKFEPNEKLLNAMRDAAPRKVFMVK